MATLTKGASGPEVTKLQQQLAASGFDPGKIDGEFRGGTEAALIAFQKSEGLLPDGVAGPRTLAKLGLAGSDETPVAVPGVSVAMVSEMFPNTPIGNIKANLPPVMGALTEARLADKPMVLMALATIRAETEGFVPVSEGQSRFNTSPNGHPFDLYDHRKDLGNLGPPDGANFRGRGFIQLTGRANYAKFGAAIAPAEDLLSNPERANDPVVAARLLTVFLAAREMAIKQALLEGDLRTARRLVNGGTLGLERFTQAYEIGNRSIT